MTIDEYIYEVCLKACRYKRIYDMDFTHDLFIKVKGKHKDMYAGDLREGSFFSWVLTIATREYINLVKKVQKSPIRYVDYSYYNDEMMNAPLHLGDEYYKIGRKLHKGTLGVIEDDSLEIKTRDEERLNNMYKRLASKDYPLKWRLIMVEKLKGYTLREAAENCGFSFDSTCAAYRRCIKKLRKELSNDYFKYN